MTDPVTDPFFEDEKAKREHVRQMAQIQRQIKAERREFLGSVLVGIALVVVLLAVVGAVTYGVRNGQQADTRREQERARIGVECINNGYTWVNGTCIPLRGDR